MVWNVDRPAAGYTGYTKRSTNTVSKGSMGCIVDNGYRSPLKAQVYTQNAWAEAPRQGSWYTSADSSVLKKYVTSIVGGI